MSRSAPGISVALCTYNGAPYLSAQFASILSQTRLPDEIVVGDDGSSDETQALLRQLATDSRIPIRVLPSAGRLGVTANFERTLAATRHEFVLLSDQDDVWHSDRVEVTLAVLEADPSLLLVHTDARLVGADGDPLGVNLIDGLHVTGDERAGIVSTQAFATHLRRNLSTGATVALRHELLDFARPFPSTWVHDEWLTIVAAALDRARFLDRATIDYRQHGSNEIGVALGGARRRAARMLEPRDGRYEKLAARAATLEERLTMLEVSERVRRLAHRKAVFDRARAGYPRLRIARVPAVMAHLARGDYRDLSSQRRLDAVRDLLQPA